MQAQLASIKKPSILFDQELPTAKEVMAAIYCAATQYALNPSLELAKAALTLAHTLTAPEYAETKLIVEIAMDAHLPAISDVPFPADVQLVVEYYANRV